ncbi:hypothetical protein GWK47_047272 [Chionoecetes opilio]|uniref:FLYWCH-type domain-containing protein n=1 Tax=Chionoecetes opilio TaxID=41210 RepID=A0A8J5CVI8_CHIOP|nr:hypothetical protein GWK47_047272 [Chionoecetes opilio]
MSHHSAVSFQDQSPLQEYNVVLDDPVPELEIDDILESPAIAILRGASQRGSDLLLQDGYTYVIDKNLKSGQRWRCSVRNKSIKCRAAITQLHEDTFVCNPQPHTCNSKDCAEALVKIRRHIRKEAKCRPYASASTIVKEGLQKHLPQNTPIANLPKMDALIRATNKCRQKRRPKHPLELQFEWVEEALPKNFVQEDVRVGAYRHTILFTEFDLQLASQARTWYVDATFKSVQSPFKQLWGIHAFISQNKCIKQVPLIQVLMTRRTIGDYSAVLEATKARLPADVSLQSVMMDFETAVWTSFGRIYPDLQLRGCSFHWTQAVWKRIQLYGLSIPYYKKKNTYKFLRQLLCLPFLPAEQIPETFHHLHSLVLPNHSDGLHQLFAYMESTWISSRRAGFTPYQWSVFGQTVRTNNDVEGWHNNLNKLCERVGASCNVYELIDVLYKECSFVTVQHQLVAQEKIEKHQKARSSSTS